MSSLVQILALARRTSVLLIRGIRYLSFYIRLFSLQKSIQNYKPLLGFLINSISKEQGAQLASINPFYRFFLRNFLIYKSSSIDQQYRAEYPRLSTPLGPSIYILQLQNYLRGSILDTFLENTLAYSLSLGSSTFQSYLSSVFSVY